MQTAAREEEIRTDSFKTSDGINIRYTVDDFAPRWKNADTLVMLHAAFGTMNRFRAWVPHTSGRYRTVRWDMRGHGDTDMPDDSLELGIERLSRDYIELLDHLGVEKAHLVGSSTGGIIGMHAAVEHPDRFLTLSSYAAIPGLAPSTKHNDYEDWQNGVMKEGVRNFLRRTVNQRFHLHQVDPAFVDWFIEESARNDPRYLARFVHMMTKFNFGDRLAQIRCPTLFVVPSNDPVHSMENYSVLKAVPDHRFVVFEDRPHNITDAEPDRCAAELVKFLEEFERNR
ncbi:MAG: alpha/beta fold hydrolase [Gammaproteobacteria bacterium]